jgi:hypothetical protein
MTPEAFSAPAALVSIQQLRVQCMDYFRLQAELRVVIIPQRTTPRDD